MKYQRSVRLFFLVMMMVFTLILLQHCRQAEHQGSQIEYAFVQPMYNFDPYYTFEHHVMIIYQHVIEPLYRMDAQGKITPLLAVDMPYISDDRRSYTITLRDDIFFHNGQEINSEDVAYVFTRMFYADYPSIHKDLYKMITGASQMLDGTVHELSGVEIINNKRFTIHLEEPYELFLENLTLPYAGIYSKRAYLEDAYRWGSQVLVGSGPYRWHRIQEPDRLELVRFSSYHGLQPRVPRLIFAFYPTAEEALEGYRNDKAQVMPLPLERMMREPSLASLADLKEVQRPGTISILLNEQIEPLDNPLVRQAIALAIDREMLAQQTTDGRGSVMNNYLPLSILGGMRQPLAPKQDVAMARRLLHEAGYANGLSMSIFYDDTGIEGALWLALAKQLQAVGIQLVLLPVSRQYWQEQLMRGEHAMRIVRLESQSQDADRLLYPLLSSSDSELGLWLDRARRSEDAEYRASIYHDIEVKMIQEEHLLLPLLSLPYYYLVKPYVHNQTLRVFGSHLSQLVDTKGQEREREHAYVFAEEGKT
ncbi:ABC transporter substrate-binding protein (plasmid) [Entomospira entomophila]|uniref:ABC transporter substrate-binding protein n=1 Tax=Entomospira entomophila TaxID=2719988 RepID=A0A968GDJ0_9SPIO|nr:ABC transporter substrate-binding protein [Entomospira entomophilus]NIZ41486.1 ABC transporter substrate-binding protein [Entomospira entomophilus]WDI36320.1 ABC transporter substrate-binding protein [Entomospira entomophilus]